MRTRPRQRGADGFTLLELLVVAGLLAVLLGLGVGFLQNAGGGLPEAHAAISAQLRAAATAARTRALPTEVRIEPGRDGGPARVLARVLDPLLAVHFEPGERTINPGLEPRVRGLAEPAGRFGHARRPSPGKPETVLEVPLPPGTADLRAGFALRMEVLLQDRQPAVLVRIGPNLELGLDGEGRLRARMVQRAPDGRGGPAATLQCAEPVPLHRWCSVELAHDGSALWCAVDGQELARAEASGSLHQQPGDRLEFAPGDTPLPGALDEVALLGYAESEPLRLPWGVGPEQELRIAFDRYGEVVGAPVIGLRLPREERIEVLRVGSGGVLQ
jgi:prepilin-type N-terminal cleavage/methylation domain-containing protein